MEKGRDSNMKVRLRNFLHDFWWFQLIAMTVIEGVFFAHIYELRLQTGVWNALMLFIFAFSLLAYAAVWTYYIVQACKKKKQYEKEHSGKAPVFRNSNTK